MIHDVCLQKLGVTLCIDRAGLVGEDGDTHQGVFDIAMLMSMPNMTVFSPATQAQLVQMVRFAANYQAPLAIRYPRTALPMEDAELDTTPLFAWMVREIRPVTLVATGKMWALACEAVRTLQEHGLEAGLIYAGCLKPLDEKAVERLAQGCSLLVTLEDGVVKGGFGASLAQAVTEKTKIQTLHFGMPDAFVPQGTVEELWQMLGLTPKDVAQRILQETER